MILICTHLMADYVFQTSKIALNKSKSLRGVVIHGIIVLLVSTIILSIYGLIGVLIAGIISVIHFTIDYTKMKARKYLRFGIVYYLIDQTLHLGVIIVCEYWFRSVVDEPIIQLRHVGVLNYAIIITLMATVITNMVLTDIYGDGLFTRGVFIKNERIFDSLLIILVAIAFNNTFVGIITLAMASVGFVFTGIRYFKYSRYQMVFKLMTFLVIGSAFRFLVNY